MPNRKRALFILGGMRRIAGCTPSSVTGFFLDARMKNFLRGHAGTFEAWGAVPRHRREPPLPVPGGDERWRGFC
jgi:hypothetical protein